MSRFTYCYFFRPGILTLPGLSSYPPVKIADRNAKHTPIIRITVMIGTSCKFINSLIKYTLFPSKLKRLPGKVVTEPRKMKLSARLSVYNGTT
jgi:hypothetical protein